MYPCASSTKPSSASLPVGPSTLLSSVDAILAEAEAVLQREVEADEKDGLEEVRRERLRHAEAQQQSAQETAEQLRAHRRAVITAYKQQRPSSDSSPSAPPPSHLPVPPSLSTPSASFSRPIASIDVAAAPLQRRDEVLRMKAEIAVRAQQRLREAEALARAEEADTRRRELLTHQRQREEAASTERALREAQQQATAAALHEEETRKSQAKRDLEERKRKAADEVRLQKLQAKREQREAFIQQRVAVYRKERERRMMRSSMGEWRRVVHAVCQERRLKALSVWRFNSVARHFHSWREGASHARAEREAIKEARAERLRAEQQTQAEQHWKTSQTHRSAASPTCSKQKEALACASSAVSVCVAVLCYVRWFVFWVTATRRRCDANEVERGQLERKEKMGRMLIRLKAKQMHTQALPATPSSHAVTAHTPSSFSSSSHVGASAPLSQSAVYSVPVGVQRLLPADGSPPSTHFREVSSLTGGSSVNSRAAQRQALRDQEREQRQSAAVERRRRKEEEAKQERLRREEEERVRREEEKKSNADRRREAKQRKREEEEEQQRLLELRQQQLALASLHHNIVLVARCGWRPWRQFIDQARRERVDREKREETSAMKRILRKWRVRVVEKRAAAAVEEERKSRRAKHFHLCRVQAAVFRPWKEVSPWKHQRLSCPVVSRLCSPTACGMQ